MRRGEEKAVMELAPRLGWLFGLAPLPARPAGAPVRRARCAGEEDEAGELSSQERARDRRARMLSFLRSAGGRARPMRWRGRSS